MTYAVELFFDEVTEARLRDLWAVLEGELPRVAHFSSPHYRPHVSLAVLEHDDPRSLGPVVGPHLAALVGRPVQLSGLGLFLDPGRTLAFLTVTGSEELARAQRSIAGALTEAGARVNPFSVPENWTPHCTLPYDATPDIPALVSTVRTAGLPIRATWADGLLIDFSTEQSVPLLATAAPE
jgi:hypothetical protein